MNGFSIAEKAHVAVILPPASITGGTGNINPAVALKNYKHASIIIALGAEATQLSGLLQVFLCATAAGGSPVAIPFNYYFQAAGGAGNDVLSSIQNALAAGVTMAVGNAPPNGCIVIEIDADELEASTVGGALAGSLGVDSYVTVAIPSAAAANFACVVAVLSGARFANAQSPTVTT
jgi:hypothetical protein